MKILHTADWQIGMRARHVAGGGAQVRAARIASAAALAKIVKDHAIDAVLVAGDVFEDNAVERSDVQRVVDACVGFGVPTYVLPGNHDPLTNGSVWEHGAWSAARNVTVLRRSEPLVIADGVTLFACPAAARMSSADPTAWIAGASSHGTRIGIAHGTVVNAVVAEDCFPIRADAASALGLDYLALGHWHSFATYDGTVSSARMAYSGTHETTKFGERDSGNVVVVEIAGRGAPPHLTRVPTGALHWHQLVREIGTDIDVENLLREIDALPDPARTLLDVRLAGVIRPAAFKLVGELRTKMAARFALLARLDDSKLMPAPEDGAWTQALPPGLLREVARTIQAGEPEHAAQALLELYRLSLECGEVAA